MEPEVQPSLPEAPASESNQSAPQPPEIFTPIPEPQAFESLMRVFIGEQGLRAGWSVVIFALLAGLIGSLVGFAFVRLHLVNFKNATVFTASSAFFQEAISFLTLLGAGALVALIERRRSLLAFNLTGPRSTLHFFGGFAAGFVALSALVAALAMGGWMHFGAVALSGVQIFKYGALWAAAFLLVGCCEEGLFRAYLLFTLTRGINFWWALGIDAALCASLVVKDKGNGAWGVYAFALLGLLPCLLLHLKKTRGDGFWQAAWVTSTFFGYIHTGNNGENWVGIFAAALIGFVFCVSVWVTGSAWWAIGCHAAWDWAETYFYGTADSGLQARGHLLSASPTGNALWSGGADGPEGSLLVLGVILLLLAALLAIHGRRNLGAPGPSLLGTWESTNPNQSGS
jgi:membrane protease YdiL (CAAX protease family)